MNRLAIVLLATAIISVSASAQQSAPRATDTTAQQAQDATNRIAPHRKDRIGLSATQRQMIAWSIAGLGHMQSVPPRFEPKSGAKVPDDVSVSQVPGVVQGVAPPAAGYEYAMLADKDLLLIKPQDDTVADVIHLNRRL